MQLCTLPLSISPQFTLSFAPLTSSARFPSCLATPCAPYRHPSCPLTQHASHRGFRRASSQSVALHQIDSSRQVSRSHCTDQLAKLEMLKFVPLSTTPSRQTACHIGDELVHVLQHLKAYSRSSIHEFSRACPALAQAASQAPRSILSRPLFRSCLNRGPVYLVVAEDLSRCRHMTSFNMDDPDILPAKSSSSPDPIFTKP